MSPFMPRNLREWTPRRQTHTRCFWCLDGPHRLGDCLHLIEGPIRWNFCSAECCDTWMQRRLNVGVDEWLKLGLGERAKVLNPDWNADPPTAEVRRTLARIRSDDRLALSLPPRP